MTAALIIAAGERSGRGAFDPGLKVGTISAIARIVLLFQQSGIREIVVCGEDEEVKKLVPAMNLVFLPCPEGGQMLDSIQTGLHYLQKKAEEVLICHVDIPLFSVRTVSALLAAEGAVCVPSCQGRRGHPILLRQPCYAHILAYRGEGGLKGAIEASDFRRTIVEVEDQGILSQPEDFDALLPDHDIRRLRLAYQFRIGREAVFYGPGVHQLLLLTDELQSLLDACKYMGISYSKGRKIIQTMEEQMGCSVLVSRQGGRGGGNSQLTWEARDLVRRYEAFSQEAEAALRSLFAKHFEEELPHA